MGLPSGQPNGHDGGRFVGAIFGLGFFGIGLTVLVSLWLAPWGAFHSPPFIFRIIGSFISLMFLAVGGSTARAALFGHKPRSATLRRIQTSLDEETTTTRKPAQHLTTKQPLEQVRTPAGAYTCESCGAPLSSDADVSPLGDVKCVHCGRWFNIHQE